MHALFAKVNGQWRFEGMLVEDAGVPYLNIIKRTVEEENGLDTFRAFDLEANEPISGLANRVVAPRLTGPEADAVLTVLTMALAEADQLVDNVDLSAMRRAIEKLAVSVEKASG